MSTAPTAGYDEGLDLLKKGKVADAERRFRVALAETPHDPELHNHLGTTLLLQSRFAESKVCFVRTLELKPQHAEALHNLGNSLRRLGEVRQAVDYYRQALGERPAWSDAHNNLGLALRHLGQLAEAEHHFRQALAEQPQHAESRNNLGVVLVDQGKWDEAAPVYRQVLRQRPSSPETHNNLGVVLVKQGRYREAIEHYQTALRLKPNYPDACNNLGNALRQEGRLDEAEQSLRRALELKPDYSGACNNLAIVLVKEGKLDEAVVHYEQAIRLQPDYADAHKNLGLALLLGGNYARGWSEYDWRWRTREMPDRQFRQPRWQGEPCPQGTILMHAEQGLGDTLQFIRYAALAKERAGTIVVECQPALMPLLSRTPGIDQLIPQGKALPDFDSHIPLLSAPGIFTNSPESVLTRVPYLFADPVLVERWRERLREAGKFRIGIAWQGSPRYPEDRFRSVPLAQFGRLAQIDSVRLISLQKGFGSNQLAAHAERFRIIDLGKSLDEEAGPFMDTAAVMMNLDLVITSDTAIAHLAGGLGVPAWVVLPKAPDWRWLQDRADCPWYPRMRLFRQKNWGNWDEVFEQVAIEVQKLPALENPEFYKKTGRAFLAAGQLPEAVQSFRRSLELNPADSTVQNDLGVVLDRQEQKNEALACFQKAVELKADNVEALFNLGNLLRNMDRLSEAESWYRQALRVDPNSPDLCNHLGISLLWQAKHDEAEASFRRAVRLRPNHSEALNNLGIVLEQVDRLDEAVEAYRASLGHKEAPDTHKNLALVQLLRGEYAQGWLEYGWRWKCDNRDRPMAQPRWDGRHLEGKPILLWAEQGLGDMLQFVRYASLVRQRGGFVILEVPSMLKALLSRSPGIDSLITQGTPLPEFVCHAPLLDLPEILRTTLDTIPADVPYIEAEPDRVDYWRKQLPLDGRFKIGINWQGSPKYGGDRMRSIPLTCFEPLARLPNIVLVSLQKGFGSEQLKNVPDWDVLDLSERLDAEGSAFIDTAAVMKNMDLIITSDTAMVHLAGALGVPTWLALCRACDWRWLRGRDECLWYPNIRLFRQRRWGDWKDIFERMANELRGRHAAHLVEPIHTEISPGELIDKITILEIKRRRLTNERQRHNVRLELGALLAARARCLSSSQELERWTKALKSINENLWSIEDEIREFESKQDFGERFIELARAVYHNNDERSRIKRKINELFGSALVEEKSYAAACHLDRAGAFHAR